MKTFLWIILVILNVLLVLALINAIGYTMKRRLLKNMQSFRSFRRKLEIHIAACWSDDNNHSIYIHNTEEHIKQLQLTIFVNRHGSESTYKAELFCPLHNHTERFDVTKDEFDAASKIIEGKKS